MFGSDILSLYPQPKPKPLSFESLPQVLQLCGPSDVSSVNVSFLFLLVWKSFLQKQQHLFGLQFFLSNEMSINDSLNIFLRNT